MKIINQYTHLDRPKQTMGSQWNSKRRFHYAQKQNFTKQL